MTNEANLSLLHLTGLWAKESKKGEEYLTGTIKAGTIKGIDDDLNVYVFERRPKKNDDINKSYPTFMLCSTNINEENYNENYNK